MTVAPRNEKCKCISRVFHKGDFKIIIRQPRYSPEEAGKLGDMIYDRVIRSLVEPKNNEKKVAIDLDSD